MNQHNDFAIEKTESHQPFFTVAFTNVLAGDRKVVPNGLCALEVQAAVLDVVTSLRLVPGGHEQIVATICSDAKGSFAPVEPRNQRGLTSPMSGRAGGRSPLAKVRLDGLVRAHLVTGKYLGSTKRLPGMLRPRGQDGVGRRNCDRQIGRRTALPDLQMPAAVRCTPA